MNYDEMTSDELFELAENKKLEESNIKTGELQLYVWEEFEPDYTSGLAFTLARSLKDAKRQVMEERNSCDVYGWGTLTVHGLTDPITYRVSGGG